MLQYFDMRRLFLLAAAFMGLLLMSVLSPSAQAYMTPDQVIFDTESFYPPNTRGAQDRVRLQNERGIHARQKVYSELEEQRLKAAASSSSSSSAPATQPADAAAILQNLAAIVGALQQGNGTAFEPIPGSDETEVPMTPEEKRRERMIERLDEREQSLHGAAWYGEEQLHGGAPLYPTGMGTIVVVALAMGAGVWTLRKAAKGGFVKVEM
jgi:hypothetical protein